MAVKKSRKWQNLLHCKCPNCGSKMEDKGNYFCCPNQHETEEGRSCFFIKKDRVIEYLTDKNHPAYFCLTEEEQQSIERFILDIKN